MREFKVKISNELHSALQHIAQARGQTVTALVKRAIRQELADFGPIRRDEQEQGQQQEPGGVE